MTDDVFDIGELISDAELLAIPKEEKLASLANMAQRQNDLEMQMITLQEKLDSIKKEYEKVSEYDIPDLMAELGLKDFRLSNGVKISVKPYYSGKITDPKAYEWLEKNGHGDIIKGELTVAYPKGFDQSKLEAIAKVAQEIGLPAVNKEEVHNSTLRAWIGEMVKTGKMFPHELFNAFIGKRAKLSLK